MLKDELFIKDVNKVQSSFHQLFSNPLNDDRD